MTPPITQCCDCAVIGGGPGGLAAAIYLARFNRQVIVFDAGQPRARLSPWNRNYPGFPDGISGADLVKRFRAQAEEFKVRCILARVTSLTPTAEGFCIGAGKEAFEARRVILATGVQDRWPEVPNVHELAGKYIRVCPICDAYETNRKRVGLIGSGDKVAREALYLRRFTADVTLFTTGLRQRYPIDPALLGRLPKAAIGLEEAKVERLEPLRDEGVRVCMEGGGTVEVDRLFAALGCQVHSELATGLGAEADELGYLHVDAWQQTTVPGLYAVGDVTTAINQVTVAVGQAAIAATAVHNSLLDF
jgi:thioredoxin reductase (NADPH)